MQGRRGFGGLMVGTSRDRNSPDRRQQDTGARLSGGVDCIQHHGQRRLRKETGTVSDQGKSNGGSG